MQRRTRKPLKPLTSSSYERVALNVVQRHVKQAHPWCVTCGNIWNLRVVFTRNADETKPPTDPARYSVMCTSCVTAAKRKRQPGKP